MPIARVELPDGKIGRYDVPEGMSPQQIEAFAFEQYYANKPESKLVTAAKDVAKSIPGAIPRAAAGLVGLPQTAMDLASRGITKVINVAGDVLDVDAMRNLQAPTSEMPNIGDKVTEGYDRMSQAVTGSPVYRPQTGPGRVADMTAQTLVGGPGSLSVKAATGVSSGLAGEAARSAGIDNPIALGVIQMLGGMAPGLAFALRSVPADNINRALQGVTDQQLTAAQKLMDDARRMGTPLTGAEALAQVTGRNLLQDIQRVVEQSSKGAPIMQGVMNNRPAANRQAFTTAADQIGAMPGQTDTTAGRVVQAAEGEVKRLQDYRSAAARPYYQAQENADRLMIQSGGALQGNAVSQAVGDIVKRINADIELYGIKSERGKILAQLRNELAPDGKPLEYSTQLEGLYKTYRDLTDLPPLNAQPADKMKAGVVGKYLPDMDAAVKATSPNIAQGRAVYRDISQRVVDPIEKGEVGSIANVRKEAGTDLQAQSASLRNRLMPTDPDPISPPVIRDTVARLNQQDPTAARDFVRQSLEYFFNKTANLQSGANQAGGAKFAFQVAGNPAQRDNLQALVEASAGRQAWVGFNRFLEVLEAQGKRQAPGSQTAQNQILQADMAAGGAGAPVAAALSPNKALSIIGNAYDTFRYGKNTAEMARILTDEKSIELMKQLAKEAPMSARAALLTNQILAGQQPSEVAAPNSTSR